MITKLPQPLMKRLPNKLLHKIRSQGNSFYYENIRLELKGTTLYMCLETWKCVETAFHAEIELNEHYRALKEAATTDSHKVLLAMLRSRGSS